MVESGAGARAVSRRDVLRITAVGGLGLALGSGLVAALARQAGLHRVRETRNRLGTMVELTMIHAEADVARAGVAAGFAGMKRLEGVLSRHQRGTPMWALNRSGRLDAAPAELLHLLEQAARYHRLTRGAFDPTVAPLLELWADRHGRDLPPPGDDELERARARIGFEKVEVRGEDVRLTRPGMALSLDGIAKGYVVDRTTAALVEAGAERVLVDAGGDMASGGLVAAGDPWTVGVQDPHHPEGLVGRVRLAGDAVATSGDYLRAFTPDRRHHHIVDPRTGRSPDRTSSVTVTAPTAMDADALSTALLVLGPDEGLRLLDRVPGAEGILVEKDGTRHSSQGMEV